LEIIFGRGTPVSSEIGVESSLFQYVKKASSERGQFANSAKETFQKGIRPCPRSNVSLQVFTGPRSCDIGSLIIDKGEVGCSEDAQKKLDFCEEKVVVIIKIIFINYANNLSFHKKVRNAE